MTLATDILEQWRDGTRPLSPDARTQTGQFLRDALQQPDGVLQTLVEEMPRLYRREVGLADLLAKHKGTAVADLLRTYCWNIDADLIALNAVLWEEVLKNREAVRRIYSGW